MKYVWVGIFCLFGVDEMGKYTDYTQNILVHGVKFKTQMKCANLHFPNAKDAYMSMHI